jgi:hypothetical protein
MSTRRDSAADKRQKSQYRLALPEESSGAAPMAFEAGTESELAKRKAESPATEQWMGGVCGRENRKQALGRVKANKGGPGIDRMTVEQFGSGPGNRMGKTLAISPPKRNSSGGKKASLGLPELTASLTCRTARCGPACPVVWQGRVSDHSPCVSSDKSPDLSIKSSSPSCAF